MIRFLLLVLLVPFLSIEARNSAGDEHNHVERARSYGRKNKRATAVGLNDESSQHARQKRQPVAMRRKRKKKVPTKPTSSDDSSTHTQQEREPRIVGGAITGADKYLHFVRIDDAAGRNITRTGICGGNLIAPDVVLTAGHCLKKNLRVVVNGYNRSRKRLRTQRSRRVERTIRHPLFNGTTWNYDYLLLKLRTKVEIKPIRLNFNESVPQMGDDLIAVGLGRRTEAGNLSYALRDVTIPASNQTACVESYAKINRNVTLNNMLCAGAPEKSPCKGDSGGPLLTANATNRTLVGIISWGAGCGRKSFPTIYARVSGVQKWLENNICDLSDFPPTYLNCPKPPLPALSKAPIPTPAPKQSPTIAPKPTDIPIKTPAIRGSQKPSPKPSRSSNAPPQVSPAKTPPTKAMSTPPPTAKAKGTPAPTPKASPANKTPPPTKAKSTSPPAAEAKSTPPPTAKAKTTPSPTPKASVVKKTPAPTKAKNTPPPTAKAKSTPSPTPKASVVKKTPAPTKVAAKATSSPTKAKSTPSQTPRAVFPKKTPPPTRAKAKPSPKNEKTTPPPTAKAKKDSGGEANALSPQPTSQVPTLEPEVASTTTASPPTAFAPRSEFATGPAAVQEEQIDGGNSESRIPTYTVVP